VGKERDPYRILVGKTEGKKQPGRPRYKRDDIKKG
jgi:hypothetical protein